MGLAPPTLTQKTVAVGRTLDREYQRGCGGQIVSRRYGAQIAKSIRGRLGTVVVQGGYSVRQVASLILLPVERN